MSNLTSPLFIYNSLKREKEIFKPITSNFVGMYVCGPTVYGEPHLGHARSAITYDVIFRYLRHLGYKVRYVRNITDVGHLEDEDSETGEDKITKKARLEQLEPMEVAQYYTLKYRQAVEMLGCLPPNIEPIASGHIPEQIDLIKKLLDKGFAYESGGSVYFDVVKYAKSNNYGELSGKVLDDLMTGTRQIKGREEKKNSVDFALWKKNQSGHLMFWRSPWGEGFPGWHLECTAMSKKYLGVPFDIHGGGMDLQFPHHECEIAQCVGAYEQSPVNYWIHNNMLTLNGQKMSKSLGNFINLEELFSGHHSLLTRPFSAMVVRFFILQSHYRSTLDFSLEALQSSEKGYKRLMSGLKALRKVKRKDETTKGRLDDEVDGILTKCYESLNDDFNTAKTLGEVFDLVTLINRLHDKPENGDISHDHLKQLKKKLPILVSEVLGLGEEPSSSEESNDDVLAKMMDLIIELRGRARLQKDFDTADLIRGRLQDMNIILKDGRDKTTFLFK